MNSQPPQSPFQAPAYGTEGPQPDVNALTLSMSAVNRNYWCHLCAMPQSDCICTYVDTTNPWPAYQSSPISPISPLHPTFSWGQAQYDQLKSVSPTSISPAYSDTSSSTASSQQFPTWSMTPTSANFPNPPAPAETTSRPRTRSAMSRDEAKEKRLQQNRKSQQSFRHRQAKLVEDLKVKVEALQKENEDLIRVISSFGDAGEIVRDKMGKRERSNSAD